MTLFTASKRMFVKEELQLYHVVRNFFGNFISVTTISKPLEIFHLVEKYTFSTLYDTLLEIIMIPYNYCNAILRKHMTLAMIEIFNCSGFVMIP